MNQSEGISVVKILVIGVPPSVGTQFINSINMLNPSSIHQKYGAILPPIFESLSIGFGELKIDQHTMLHFYDIPNPEVISPFWDILAQNCIGDILVMHDYSDECISAALKIINFYLLKLRMVSTIVINSSSPIGTFPLQTIRKKLKLPKDVQMFECDIARPASVKVVLLGLLEHIYHLSK
ncbi:MAG: hypothetical protein HXX08_06600 [Chloroflexi bacterium]|uniref:Uncharacterized protein n=1 Tax=Candidatus Chlorohelix allophototropha TaxID=3003348 RepID=A0A8T7M0R6_9CHLR|nr:hypothetical protein [Chloroflexota bacterium]WJW67402.1 hypothetical protein OZ401_000668 [Chloroflexota bacterium L227-S17]